MFGFASTADDVLAGRDVRDLPVVVTGGTAGIGFETARALAAHGARVAITGRDPGKAAAALEELAPHARGAAPEGFVLDLAALGSVRKDAATIATRFPEIGVLIANAGVMNTPFGRTADGFEMQFGVNHLGHFALTTLLEPALLAAVSARIVILSSSAHLRGDVLWDDPNWHDTPYDKLRAYASSKSANMLFAVALEARLRGRGVHAFGVNPGAAITNLHRHMTDDDISAAKGRVAQSGGVRIKSVAQAAASSIWAAVDPAIADNGGTYIEDCAVAGPHIDGLSGVAAHALDRGAAGRLWAMSERLIAAAG